MLFKIRRECAFLDTHCAIFAFKGGDQLSLTKDDFCEMISIYRGNNAKKEIQDFLGGCLNSFSSEAEGKSRIDYIGL